MHKRFGVYLRNLRLDRGMTLRDVEAASGVSNSYVSQVERGRRNPPHPDKLRRLAEIYRVPLAQMMEAAGFLERGTTNDTDPRLASIRDTYDRLDEARRDQLKAYADALGQHPPLRPWPRPAMTIPLTLAHAAQPAAAPGSGPPRERIRVVHVTLTPEDDDATLDRKMRQLLMRCEGGKLKEVAITAPASREGDAAVRCIVERLERLGIVVHIYRAEQAPRDPGPPPLWAPEG